MKLAEKLRPIRKDLLIDIVSRVGISTEDWKNFKGKDPASNPKYCYEWSFIDKVKEIALFNLWYREVVFEDDNATCRLNLRQQFKNICEREKNPKRAKRAMDFDSTLKYVAKNNIPVRVSLQEGHMLDKDEMGADGSKVKARILDDEPWSVSYDMKTGECVLTRGIIRGMATDQFGYLKIDPSYRTLKGQVLNRSKKVREIALLRSKGHCECCGEKGFETEDGRLFLETHHIEPLSEGGDDSSENVIALCANHHRQAHYGKDKGEFRKLLVKALRKKLLLCG